MRFLVLLLTGALLILGGCAGDDEEPAGDRTWSATTADNISQGEPVKSARVPCPPKLRKFLRKADEVSVAGEGPVACARAVVADLIPPKGERPPAVQPAPPDIKGPINARVSAWHDRKGWGSLTAREAPGGIFVPFSAIEGEGYRSLREGQVVEVEYTEAVPGGQDGNAWVAERVTPRG